MAYVNDLTDINFLQRKAGFHKGKISWENREGAQQCLQKNAFSCLWLFHYYTANLSSQGKQKKNSLKEWEFEVSDS